MLRELAMHTQPPRVAQAYKQAGTCARLKACREKAPCLVPDSEAMYNQKKERAARALAQLSLSCAPRAGIAMGLQPWSAEAKEVAAIKARD